jgi:hypothetical protein
MPPATQAQLGRGLIVPTRCTQRSSTKPGQRADSRIDWEITTHDSAVCPSGLMLVEKSYDPGNNRLPFNTLGMLR